MPLFARLNRQRDVVFVDQRGTGKSQPLACDQPKGSTTLARQLDPEVALDLLRQCAAKLRADGVDTSRYLTVDAVKDFDAVRQALGYPKINLWGVSYGTRVELEYLRQYPQHVRSAILDSVAPPDMRLPVSFAIDSDAALDGVIGACASQQACASAHPQLRARIDTLFAELRAHSRVVRITHPLSGQVEAVNITLRDFASWVRAPLYSPVSASLVPTAIAAAAEGNFDALAASNLELGGADGSGVSMGMHLSVICGEDMTRVTPADLASIAGTRFGRSFYDGYQQLCSVWRSRPAPADFFEVPTSEVPILMLEGGADPATPPRHAQALLNKLHHAHLLVAPNLGHTVSLSGCAPDIVEGFIKSPDGPPPDGSCLIAIPRPPFFEPIIEGGS
jgi:pimeloyl-ACP methyl ester carboxylesterase